VPRGRGIAHGQAGRHEEPSPRGQQGQQRQQGPRGAVRAQAQALPRPGAEAPSGQRRQQAPEPAPRQQARRERPTARREQRPPLRLAAGRALLLGQRAVAIGLGLAVLAAFVVGVAEQRWKEWELRAEVAARTAELRAAEERNQELKGQLAASDPEGYRAYVEATARKQLNLGYPDETVVIVAWNDPPGGAAPPPSPPTATQTPAQASTPPVWKQWLWLLTGE
jgi:cell division protein FtsB